MYTIDVSHLSRTFKIYQKEPGVAGSLRSLFNRKHIEARAVDDVSFSIRQGELVGFIGPNGAGKTTTLKCLSGLLYPTAGHVKVLGFTPFDRKHEFLRQISLVMGQKNQLWWDLPAMESFLLNKEIYQIPEHTFKKTVDELISLLDVSDIINVQVRKLSLGQRMKCELIAALLHRPKVLFLDEPTIGLDVVMQQRLREFIKEYNKVHNSTIILTSHYMKDVHELCERVIVINHGKVLFDGHLDDIIKKYSTDKRLVLTMTKPIDRSILEQLGTVEEYQYPKVSLAVPVDRSNQVAAKLLQDYAIEDLTIQEPDIEEIIRDIFLQKKSI